MMRSSCKKAHPSRLMVMSTHPSVCPPADSGNDRRLPTPADGDERPVPSVTVTLVASWQHTTAVKTSVYMVGQSVKLSSQ